MAYSKTPEQDTHSKYRIKPSGNQSLTSNTLGWQSYAGSKYVNCFPVIRESKQTDPTISLMKAPALLQKTWTFPDTDVGVTQFDFDTGIFVYKDRIYRVSDSGSTGPTIELLETDTNAGIFLTCQKVIDYALAGDIIVAGLYAEAATYDIYAYAYNVTTSSLYVGTDLLCNGSASYWTPTGYADDIYVMGAEEVASPRDLIIDGYHIVALKSEAEGTNRVLVSRVATGTTDDFIAFDTAVDYFTPEIDPDNLVDIQKHHNYICVIGTKTVEFFYNAAIEAGSPFVRQENYTILLGASQNLSANAGAVSVAHGDDIYFFANAMHGGNAIYLIRDFKAVKISDDYIDHLLNNAQGVVSATNPSQAKLGLVDNMGSVCVGVELTNSLTGEITTYVFDEQNKVWWEWNDSDANGLVFTTRGFVSSFSGQPFFIRGGVLGLNNNAQYTIANITVNQAGSTIVLDYVSKDPDYTAYTAMYITAMQDLDVNNWKHIKGIDAIGDYSDNTISLAWTKYTDWSNWSQEMVKTPASLGYDQAIRWYNLGHCRRFALRAKFDGNQQIKHDAFEVSYNIRTQ
jgi:hypothetical protein